MLGEVGFCVVWGWVMDLLLSIGLMFFFLLWFLWSVVLFWGLFVIWFLEFYYCFKGILWGLEFDVWCFLWKVGYKDVGELGLMKSLCDVLLIYCWFYCRIVRWCRFEELKILGICVICLVFFMCVVIEGLC